MTTKSTKKVKTETRDLAFALTDRKFWTIVIEPEASKVLGENLYRGVVVMKNHGLGTVDVETGYTNYKVTLRPGDLQMIPVHNKIVITVVDGKPASIEFDLLLALK